MNEDIHFAEVELSQHSPEGDLRALLYVGESPVPLVVSGTADMRGHWLVTNRGPLVLLIGSDPHVATLTHLRIRTGESITLSMVTTLYAMAEVPKTTSRVTTIV